MTPPQTLRSVAPLLPSGWSRFACCDAAFFDTSQEGVEAVVFVENVGKEEADHAAVGLYGSHTIVNILLGRPPRL